MNEETYNQSRYRKGIGHNIVYPFVSLILLIPAVLILIFLAPSTIVIIIFFCWLFFCAILTIIFSRLAVNNINFATASGVFGILLLNPWIIYGSILILVNKNKIIEQFSQSGNDTFKNQPLGDNHSLKSMQMLRRGQRTKDANHPLKSFQMQIPISKIGFVIGSNGRMINHIINDNDNVYISVGDDGKIIICHHDLTVIKRVEAIIKSIVYEPKIGEIYSNAIIVRKKDFGIFVKLTGSQDGLIPINYLRHKNIDIHKLNINQKITVEIVNIFDDEIELNIVNWENYIKSHANELTPAYDQITASNDVKVTIIEHNNLNQKQRKDLLDGVTGRFEPKLKDRGNKKTNN